MSTASDFGAVLRERAEQQPDMVGVTFLRDGEADEVRLTYGELDRRARHIAARLQELPGSILLIYPPGPEFLEALFGCFYAGKTAIPVYPPDPLNLSRTMPRLRHMVADARPAAVAASRLVHTGLSAFPDLLQELKGLPWVVTDALDAGGQDGWRPNESPNGRLTDQIAVLQYTSGSTRNPRGVMLSHGNLLANSRFIAQAFGHSRESSGVIWLPPYHDMGLIGGILQPIWCGFPVVLLSPMDFLRRPVRWLRAISRYRGTTSGGPNFAYDLCVHRIKPAECEGLDLSTWRVAFNGAEPIRSTTLDRFVTAFGPYGFRRSSFLACYGLAEATLAVTCTPVGEDPRVAEVEPRALSEGMVKLQGTAPEPGVRLVSSGRFAADHRCIIVDPAARRPCAPGQVGEIWISGPSVARGYWGQPEESERTFEAYLDDTGEGPFLRTGDLGAMIGDELYVTGRIKDILIIRGRNYYPSDIEATVCESHEALRPNCAAAFTVEIDGDERLVIAQEVRESRGHDAGAVILAIRQAVARNNELQVHTVVLLAPRSLHKTSSGKVQRPLCRKMFLEQRLEVVATWSLTAGANTEGPAANTQQASP